MPAVSTVTVDVRYRDIDAMGHVNNAVYATYLETARAALFAEHLGIALTDAPTVLASLQIDYHAPITLGDRVRVTCAVERVGRTSIPMTYTIRADGTDCATATTVQVVIDADSGAAAPVPEAWRERLVGED
jgi:Predicted thioesterase